MKKKSPLVIDDARHEVFARGRRVALPPLEYKILLALRGCGRTLSRDELVRRCWALGQDVGVQERTVDQHVCRLRRKFSFPVIETVSGFGFRIAAGIVS